MEAQTPTFLKRYQPLFALVFVSAAAATALSLSRLQNYWMLDFMGFALCCFAMLKFFDLRGFAEGFAKYDLLAMRLPAYAHSYPLIELGLGLVFLTHWFIWPAAVLLLSLMLLGTIGVIIALMRGLNVKCACMGTALNVPLSTVTLIEDVGMGLMAFWLLFGN